MSYNALDNSAYNTLILMVLMILIPFNLDYFLDL